MRTLKFFGRIVLKIVALVLIPILLIAELFVIVVSKLYTIVHALLWILFALGIFLSIYYQMWTELIEGIVFAMMLFGIAMFFDSLERQLYTWRLKLQWSLKAKA